MVVAMNFKSGVDLRYFDLRIRKNQIKVVDSVDRP